MWVISTSAWVTTSLYQLVLAQEVSLAAVGTFLLHTTSGLNLTNTFWVCNWQLVIRRLGCSYRTILESGPGSPSLSEWD